MPDRRKHTEPFPIANLDYLYNEGKIWLNPEYQRESVWALSQKQLLIDSIFRGIDIPKIYFREISKKSYEYEVVDGQQRLRSIFAFIKGDFKLSLESDAIDNVSIAGKKFEDLPTSLQMKFRNEKIDITVMNKGYSDDDIEETFLRLQNGTPLNAAEKRRAIAGNMKKIVEALARNKIFTLCGFSDKRFAYEDAVAKVLHMALNGTITDIKPNSIRKTYENNKRLKEEDLVVKSVSASFNFIKSAFKNKTNPKLKKFSIITLVYITNYLLHTYNLKKFKSEFADAYLSFEKERISNRELSEDEQDRGYSEYNDAARSDSIANMRYRHEFLLKYIIESIPEMSLKDKIRAFTEEQRLAIYLHDKGICQNCGVKCSEDNYHADHIVPFSNGGGTRVSNGQVLCPTCNLKKSDKC